MRGHHPSPFRPHPLPNPTLTPVPPHPSSPTAAHHRECRSKGPPPHRITRHRPLSLQALSSSPLRTSLCGTLWRVTRVVGSEIWLPDELAQQHAASHDGIRYLIYSELLRREASEESLRHGGDGVALGLGLGLGLSAFVLALFWCLRFLLALSFAFLHLRYSIFLFASVHALSWFVSMLCFIGSSYLSIWSAVLWSACPCSQSCYRPNCRCHRILSNHPPLDATRFSSLAPSHLQLACLALSSSLPSSLLAIDLPILPTCIAFSPRFTHSTQCVRPVVPLPLPLPLHPHHIIARPSTSSPSFLARLSGTHIRYIARLVNRYFLPTHVPTLTLTHHNTHDLELARVSTYLPIPYTY